MHPPNRSSGGGILFLLANFCTCESSGLVRSGGMVEPVLNLPSASRSGEKSIVSSSCGARQSAQATQRKAPRRLTPVFESKTGQISIGCAYKFSSLSSLAYSKHC